MELKPILRDLGLLLHVPGIMALTSLLVCVLANEPFAVRPFLWTAFAAIGTGQVFFWLFRRAEEMQLRHAMVTAVLAWLLVPFVGMLPFLLVAQELATKAGVSETVLAFQDPLNALFEAVSGFTATGLTVSLQPSELPRSLQWWRSFSQWIGGVGVIVLMLAVFHHTAEAGRLLYSEARDKKILPDLQATVRIIWWIYLVYTLLGIALLRLAGMPTWWEALNYGLTGIATGGFGISDASLADYGAPVRAVMVLLMTAGAISFASHYHILVKGQVNLLWRDVENRALLTLLVGGALLLLLENVWSRSSATWLDSLFQWTSALATAGFSTVRIEDWSITAQLLLAAGMVFGGAAGATTGGLKLRRIVWLARAALLRIERVSLHPWILMEHKPIAESDEREIVGPHIEAAAIIASLWGMTIALATLLLLHFSGDRTSLNAVFFEVASALGNVGLSAGITHPELAWPGKLILILLMWMGRLEILPVLVLASWLFSWRPKRLAPGIGTRKRSRH